MQLRGAREVVILSKIADLLTEYDQVIVDLPASGHALGSEFQVLL